MLDITTSFNHYHNVSQDDSYYVEDRSKPRLKGQIHNSEKTRVVARTFLRKDACSEIIDANRLATRNLPVDDQIEIAEHNGVLYSSEGLSSSIWIKHVSQARDLQSCNALLTLTGNGVTIKIRETTAPGQELFMWFDHSLLVTMGIPHLLPENIISHNNYRCNHCGKLFSSPNPLKIHMATRCNSIDEDELWARLDDRKIYPQRSSLPFTIGRPLLKFEAFELPSSSKSSHTSSSGSSLSPDSLSLSPRSSDYASDSASSPDSRPNYLKRFDTPSNYSTDSAYGSSGSETSSSPISSIGSGSPTRFHTSLGSAFATPRLPLESTQKPIVFNPLVITPDCFSYKKDPAPALPVPSNLRNGMNDSQIESFVSDLGKSGQGKHICLYCGKVCSRKYGLKIHLRTHTGYKPLQCKICHRAFGDPSNLNKHVRLHAEGETPYKCNLCGKVLVRRRDLERHLQTRHQNINVEDSETDASNHEMEIV